MAKEFLTKAELVSDMAKRAGLKKADAEKALEAFIEAVKDNLGKGKGVRLIGLGHLWLGRGNRERGGTRGRVKP